MEVILQDLGKQFGKEWVIRNVNEQLLPAERVAIVGPNGSGKSTLLKIIASFIIPTEGTITFQKAKTNLPDNQVFKHVSYAAPYLELIDQLTLEELIRYHQAFKPFYEGIKVDTVIDLLRMEKHRKKQVLGFSSGMKMRVRLVLAFLSDTSMLLLDEPLSNLDQEGKDWYRELTTSYLHDRLTVVCSNHQEEEYFFCKRTIDLQ